MGLLHNILFVTKDVGGFQVAEPIAQESKKRGHTVTIIAEGLSAEEWKKAGWQLLFEGTKCFETEPFSINIDKILQTAKPSVIAVTYGAPINLEAQFANHAAKLKIPLAGLEDVWGAHIRIPAHFFNLILTLELGEEIIRQFTPEIRAKIVEIGSPFVSSILRNPLPQDIVARFKEATKGRRTILIAGDDDETQEYLHWTLASAARTKEKFLIIWRPHPRTFATDKDKEIWDFQIRLFREFRPDTIVSLPEIPDTRIIARLADATVSNYGTLLLASAAENKIPVRVRSARGDALMQKFTGTQEYPPVRIGDKEIGAVLEFDWEKPVDLSAMVFAKKAEVNAGQDKYIRRHGNASELAVNEIEALLASK